MLVAMRHLPVICVLVLGCAVDPNSGTSTLSSSEDSGTTATDDTGTGTDTGGPPACDPVACDLECENDECGHETQAVCQDDGSCMCQSTVNCLPCSPENCGEYEACYSSHSIDGACVTDCVHEFPPFVWDPNIGCVLSLPSNLPVDINSFFDWFNALVNGMVLPRGDDCSDPSVWWLDDDITMITLCPDACALFEQAGSVVIGWGVPCE